MGTRTYIIARKKGKLREAKKSNILSNHRTEFATAHKNHLFRLGLSDPLTSLVA